MLSCLLAACLVQDSAVVSGYAIAGGSAQGLSLQVRCDPNELCWGDRLSVFASCENRGEAISVDFYLAVISPGGDSFFVPGKAVAEPYASGVFLPSGARSDDVLLLSAEAPEGLATGEYSWLLAATLAGTQEVVAFDTSAMRMGYGCWRSYSDDNDPRVLLLKGDELFIGTGASGITRMNISTGQTKRWGDVAAGLASSEVTDLCLDGEGNVWAAHGETYQYEIGFEAVYYEWGGISVFDGSKWQPYRPRTGGYFTRLWQNYRDSNYFESVAYSEADDVVYAHAPHRCDEDLGTSQIVAMSEDGPQEVIIPLDKNGERYWVGAISGIPGGGMCALFYSFDYVDWEWETTWWEYQGGKWSYMAEGCAGALFVSSDGTFLSWPGGNRSPIYHAVGQYGPGLWRLHDESWEPVEGFEDVIVFDVLEAAGKLWVLGAPYLSDWQNYFDNIFYCWDGTVWGELELFPTRGRPCAAVSDDEVVFVGDVEAGLYECRGGQWAARTFNCPERGIRGITGACFGDKQAYFISSGGYLDKLDGSSWSHLGHIVYGSSVFRDSSGAFWGFSNATEWVDGKEVVCLWRARDSGSGEEFVVETGGSGEPFVAMAEDASGALWLRVAVIGYEDGTRLCSVVVGGPSGLTRYPDILEAVETNFDVLLESKAKTDIWMVDKQRGIVWVKWVVGRMVPGIEQWCFSPGVGSFDGSEWIIYEGEIPGGASLIRFDFQTDDLGYGDISFYTYDIPVDMGPDGSVWTLSDRGLCRISRDAVWYEPSGRKDDLGPPILADDYGNVWVSRCRMRDSQIDWYNYYAGLARFDGTEWKDLTEHDVPVCDWIVRMKSAPNGDLWFLTKDGATRYSQGPK